MKIAARARGATALATTTAAVGLTAIVLLGMRALLLDSGPPPGDLQNVASTLIVGAPFALCLLALRFRDPALRGAVWIGAGVIGLVTPFLVFSIILIYGAPLNLALIVAGAWALASGGDSRRVVALVAAPLVAGVLSIAGLHAFRDPSCWYRAGDTWERRPYSRTISGPRRLSTGEVSLSGTCGQFASAGAPAVAAVSWLVAAAPVVVLSGRRGGRREERGA